MLRGPLSVKISSHLSRFLHRNLAYDRIGEDSQPAAQGPAQMEDGARVVSILRLFHGSFDDGPRACVTVRYTLAATCPQRNVVRSGAWLLSSVQAIPPGKTAGGFFSLRRTLRDKRGAAFNARPELRREDKIRQVTIMLQ
jgi:hypothetical protein